MTTAHARLPAAERRRAIVEAGLRVFSGTSYAGATTAQIAREAGVSEPIIYRHFASKRDLWFACLDAAFDVFRDAVEAKVAELGEERAVLAVFQTGMGLRRQRVLVPNLWLQGVTEAGDDLLVARHVRRHMREVHGYLAGLVRRTQAAGGMPADRDPDAEAWIFLAGGLLVSIGDRLGGLLGHEGFTAVAEQRRRWLLGEP